MAYSADRMEDFYRDVTGLLHSRRPNAHVFYNGTVTPNMRRWIPYVGQMEIESLPTSGRDLGLPALSLYGAPDTHAGQGLFGHDGALPQVVGRLAASRP